MKNKAFTLVELLVVVLIIGILAAIAVPQYQKAVLKARLHTGMPLVESIYQAQQIYALTHGDFSKEFTDLDISIPQLDKCEQGGNKFTLLYTCDFGQIVMNYGFTNIQFIETSGQITYAHFFLDTADGFKKDKRYCFAKLGNKTAENICESMGGVDTNIKGGWTYYQLD